MTTPIVILGAGPSGSTAALLLARWGHTVVVLTRRAGGEERTLAESLPPSSVALLERVGFAGLSTAGFMRYTGNTAYWGTGDSRLERFGDGRVGYQVERAHLDALLAREAASAGAEVRVGANVTGVESREGETSLAFDLDGASSRIDARWVLDCTGRVGVVARNGWRKPGHAARTMALVGIWEGDEWPAIDPSHTIVESTPEGWVWSVPVSETRRYVTLMVDPEITRVADRGALDAAYEAQLARTQRIGEIVARARRTAPVFARDASPYAAHTFGDRGTLLVGDAGSFVDPLSSFGIKKAVASAWLAAVVVHSILLDDASAGPALELFNARERTMYAALQHAAAALARDAAIAAPSRFWESRAMLVTSDPEAASEPDVAALREDPDVRRAFDDLRAREALRVRGSTLVRRTRRPAVRGNRVVVEEHLVVPAFPEGVRYIRNVDLVRLSELAPAHEQVPDLFDAYCRAAPPVALPDFLGALAVSIAKGILVAFP